MKPLLTNKDVMRIIPCSKATATKLIKKVRETTNYNVALQGSVPTKEFCDYYSLTLTYVEQQLIKNAN